MINIHISALVTDIYLRLKTSTQIKVKELLDLLAVPKKM